MKKIFVIAACCGTVLVLTYAGAQQGPSRGDPPQQFHLATPGQPIAGIPYDEAVKIFDRHVQELYALPGTLSVSFTAKGLLVSTFKPEIVPLSVEGLPLFAVPPSARNAQPGPLESDLPSSQLPPASSTDPPLVVERPLPSEPQERPCAPGYELDPVSRECRGTDPEPPPLGPQLLPPPAGVVVLKPGGVREETNSCPEGFKEEDGYGGWRFCVDPNNPESIPPLWSPPINGIPYEKALEIHRRHVEELSQLPGVFSVGLGMDGIHVYTNNPEAIPKEIEGLPIKIFITPEMEGKTLSHTYNTFVRPMHGAVAFTEGSGGAGGYGTLTGITLADGKPWLIFPAHLLGPCSNTPPCNSSLPLNKCDHYNNGVSPLLLQPVTGGVNGSVGWAPRWTPLGSNFYASDVGAAFLDSDFDEGNGSLATDRKVHDAGSGIPFLGTPIPELPLMGLQVRMRSSIGPPHELLLEVKDVNTTADNIIASCMGGSTYRLNSQIRYKVLGGYTTIGGDSGSPVFDLADRLVGMVNACYLVFQPGVGYVCDPNWVFGTDIITAKNQLKFDTLHGTQTVNDNTLGVFNTSNAQWYIDNGNGKWDGCTSGAPTKDTDQCVGAYGFTSDTPVTGDWDGNGSTTIGVYRENMAGCAPGVQCFLLRNDNSVGAPNITFNTGPAFFGSRPVVGKWPGLGTGTKVGVFRPSTGEWLLDNGDWNFNGCGLSDPCFNTPGTQVGDIPFAGDWLGNGQVGVGFFRPSTGTFYFKSALTSGAMTNQSPMVNPNQYTVLPVVGNTWTGIGTKTMFGRYIMSGIPQKPYPYWYLDNGSQTYPSCTEDQCYFFQPAGTVASALRPVAFGKSVVKAN